MTGIPDEICAELRASGNINENPLADLKTGPGIMDLKCKKRSCL